MPAERVGVTLSARDGERVNGGDVSSASLCASLSLCAATPDGDSLTSSPSCSTLSCHGALAFCIHACAILQLPRLGVGRVERGLVAAVSSLAS